MAGFSLEQDEEIKSMFGRCGVEQLHKFVVITCTKRSLMLQVVPMN